MANKRGSTELAARRARPPFERLAVHDATATFALDPQTTVLLRGADLLLSGRHDAMQVELTCADAAVQRDGRIALQGRLRAKGNLASASTLKGTDVKVELEPLHASGADAEPRAEALDAIERASLHLTIDADKIAVAGPLVLRGGLGALEVAVDCPRKDGLPIDVRGKPRGLRLGALAAQFGWDAPWADAQFDGEIALRGTPAPLSWSGTLRGDARGVRIGEKRADGGAAFSAERVGVAGRIALDASAFSLEDARLELGGSRFTGRVRAGHDGAFEASWLGEAVSLSDVGNIAGASLAGHGRVQLDVEGTLRAPLLRASVSVEDGAIAGNALGRVTMEMGVEQGGDVLRFGHAEIENAERHLAADGLVVDLRGPLRVNSKLRVLRLPLDDLYRALGAKDDPTLSRLQGIAEGGADFEFTRAPRGDALTLSLQLDLREASFDGYRFDKGRLRARIVLPDTDKGMAGGELAIEQLALGVGAGKFELAGGMQRGALKMSVGLDKLPIERLPWFAQHAPILRGRVQGKGELLGSAADPRLSLALSFEDLRADGTALGRMQVDARLSREASGCAGKPPVDAGGGASWTLCGQGLSNHARIALRVGPAPAHNVRGKIDFDRMELDAFLPERASGRRVRGSMTASLDVTGGSLQAPSQLTGALSVQKLEFGQGDALLANHAPFVLRAQRGALSLSGADLSGPKLNAKLSAGGTLGTNARLVADGTAAASLWSGMHALVNPFGEVRVHAEHELGGRSRTRVEFEPQDVTVQIGSDTMLRKLAGKLVIENGHAALEGVNAQLGGGTLALGGDLTVRGLGLDRCDLTISAHGISFQPQDRVDMTVDADAKLQSGDADQPPKLSGVLRIKSMLYARHIEFPAALMGTNKKEREDRAAYDRKRDRLLLDLTLEHEEPLRIRNNLLDTEIVIGGPRHALKLTGSDQRMGLTGKVELKRGRVLFRGDEFQLTRGEITFDEPTRIDPNFDVRAVADARKNAKANIVFAAKGNRDAFDVSVRCDAAAAPTPFTCDYARDKLRCDDFERLVQIWVCEPKSVVSQTRN